MFKESKEYKNILDNEKFKSLNNYKAHGNTSVMEHSILAAENAKAHLASMIECMQIFYRICGR